MQLANFSGRGIKSSYQTLCFQRRFTGCEPDYVRGELSQTFSCEFPCPVPLDGIGPSSKPVFPKVSIVFRRPPTSPFAKVQVCGAVVTVTVATAAQKFAVNSPHSPLDSSKALTGGLRAGSQKAANSELPMNGSKAGVPPRRLAPIHITGQAPENTCNRSAAGNESTGPAVSIPRAPPDNFGT